MTMPDQAPGAGRPVTAARARRRAPSSCRPTTRLPLRGGGGDRVVYLTGSHVNSNFHDGLG